MKTLIIAVNIVLALLLTGTAVSAFRKDEPPAHNSRTRRAAVCRCAHVRDRDAPRG